MKSPPVSPERKLRRYRCRCCGYESYHKYLHECAKYGRGHLCDDPEKWDEVKT